MVHSASVSRCGFRENRLRDAQLAYVVQDAPERNRADRALWNLEPLR